MLLTADSLWKYIQNCHNIYCLPLLLFYYFENWNKQILFSHSKLFWIFHPSSPPVLTQLQYWLHQARWQLVVRGAEKEIVTIWTHTRIRQNQSHRYILLIHIQELKGYDMHVQKDCVTKYNVQYNTHAHTPVNKSLPQNTPTQNTHLLFSLYCMY